MPAKPVWIAAIINYAYFLTSIDMVRHFAPLIVNHGFHSGRLIGFKVAMKPSIKDVAVASFSWSSSVTLNLKTAVNI